MTEFHPKTKFENEISNIKKMIDILKKCVEIGEQIIKKKPEPWLLIKKFKYVELQLKLEQNKNQIKHWEKVLELKSTEFNADFLPRFNEELKETNEKFDELYTTAIQIADKLPENNPFKQAIMQYKNTNPDNADLELRNEFYKFLKDRLPSLKKQARL